MSLEMQFLHEHGIEISKVERSFFRFPSNWQCPVCSINKFQLLHQRANKHWVPGIEIHHYGDVLPNKYGNSSKEYWEGTAYTRQPTTHICYLCNTLESTFRKTQQLNYVMSPEQMRNSMEFRERRRTMAVRNAAINYRNVSK